MYYWVSGPINENWPNIWNRTHLKGMIDTKVSFYGCFHNYIYIYIYIVMKTPIKRDFCIYYIYIYIPFRCPMLWNINHHNHVSILYRCVRWWETFVIIIMCYLAWNRFVRIKYDSRGQSIFFSSCPTKSVNLCNTWSLMNNIIFQLSITSLVKKGVYVLYKTQKIG